MGKRYCVIDKGNFPESRPFVLAVCCDPETNREWSDEAYAVLEREIALLDPQYREAVLAWDSGDDTEFEAEIARFEKSEDLWVLGAGVVESMFPGDEEAMKQYAVSGGWKSAARAQDDVQKMIREKPSPEDVLQAVGFCLYWHAAALEGGRRGDGREFARKAAALARHLSRTIEPLDSTP